MTQAQAQQQSQEQTADFFEETEADQPKQEIGTVYQRPDGSFEWTYCMDMKTDPMLFEIVFMVLGISFAVILAILLLLAGLDFEMLGVILLCFIVITLIGLFSLWFAGTIYGWKYYMVYRMDEKGISMSQISEQAAKTKLLADLTALTGALTHSPVLIANSIAQQNSSAYSEFSRVNSVSANPRRHRITLRTFLLFNIICVEDPYYDFVLKFIRSRCTRASQS